MSKTVFEPVPAPKVPKVLVMLGSPFLYGLERSVIELFDQLRPEVCPELVMSNTVFRRHLPITQEVIRRRLPYRLLPDKREWPRIGRPHSLREACGILESVVQGNLSVLRAARGKDMLYVAGPLGGVHSVLAAMYLRCRRKRVIHHFHDLMDKPSRLLRFWAFFVTDFIHFTGIGFQVAVSANPVLRRKRNFIIPGLMDLPLEDTTGAKDSDNAKREIFYVGQVAFHKGIDILVEAFAHLESGNARLNIVGGPQPPQFKEQFEDLVRQYSPPCEIRYLGYQSDVRQYLRTAYLHVHPSPPSRFSESYGRAVVEAMSLGIPSICFRSGALQEIVVNGETGIVCEEESAACLAEAMDRLLGDRRLRDQSGARARERFLRLYSLQTVRSAWLDFFLAGRQEKLRPEAAEYAPKPDRRKALVLLGSPFLYGLEHSVIEKFDKLRPEIDPHFILTYTSFRKQLPILGEIQRRGLSYSFLPDKREWPRIGKPHSLREAWGICVSMVRGNLCLLRSALGADMLYVASPLGGLHSLLAAVYLRMRRKRVIHHFHDLMDQPSSLLRFWTFFATDFVHYTRTSYRGVVDANPFIRRKRNFIIPCLLDLPSVDAEDGSKVSNDGKREVLYVGQVSPHKGIDLLLEAFRQLGHENVRLNIVGAPPSEYRAQFEALTERCSEVCEVRYLGYQSDVRKYLRSAYLHVHPSPPSRFNESYGRAVVEAMSLGIPSVCFRSGSLQEIVVNGETGIVCEEETPECLAAAIVKFLADPEFRDACGSRARHRYETVYSEAAVRPMQVNFYLSGLAPRA